MAVFLESSARWEPSTNDLVAKRFVLLFIKQFSSVHFSLVYSHFFKNSINLQE